MSGHTYGAVQEGSSSKEETDETLLSFGKSIIDRSNGGKDEDSIQNLLKISRSGYAVLALVMVGALCATSTTRFVGTKRSSELGESDKVQCEDNYDCAYGFACLKTKETYVSGKSCKIPKNLFAEDGITATPAGAAQFCWEHKTKCTCSEIRTCPESIYPLEEYGHSSKKVVAFGASVMEQMAKSYSENFGSHQINFVHGMTSGSAAHLCVEDPNQQIFPASGDFDVMVQFGCHEIAHHVEREDPEKFRKYMQHLFNGLANLQQERHERGETVRLILTTVTPVETHPDGECTEHCEGEGCGMVPYRSNDDIDVYNNVLMDVMNESSGSWKLFDAHDLMQNLCGGKGYVSCPEYQLPLNVHFNEKGAYELAKKLEETLTN